MELLSIDLPQDEVVLCPINDIQYSGKSGPAALDVLDKHIKRCISKNGHYLGLGDYTDFMSPSNRQRLKNAGLYDTAGKVIEDAALRLNKELYDDILKPTTGKWLGLLKGHHTFDLADGTNTDVRLAKLLDTYYLGTSALVRVRYGAHKQYESVVYMHHGRGGGATKGAPLNTLDRVAAGWDADIFLMGHTCATPAVRFSRIVPVWNNEFEDRYHTLKHKEILLVNTGGFCKSSIVGNKMGGIPQGDYAEQNMYVPASLSAPIITLSEGTARVEI